jgi:hypothetical protein
MATPKQRLELTWTGKDDRPRALAELQVPDQDQPPAAEFLEVLRGDATESS